MATVWEAHDEVLDRPVAIKILHRHLTEDVTFMARFRSEAVAVARLHHPSIVAVYDTCHDMGVEAIVMELVRGRTMREYLDEHPVLDPDEVLSIAGDVADALASAHRAGIIHRDIKPANILLSDDGRVLVTDFGIAKIHGQTDLTTTGTMLGSVKYLAPEQVEGAPVDPRSDLYALGVVLFEATCGRPPFDDDSPAATALARLHRDPPSARDLRPGLTSPMVALLDHCLARDPDRRFGSAEELRSAIDAVDSQTWSGEATVVTDSPVAGLRTYGTDGLGPDGDPPNGPAPRTGVDPGMGPGMGPALGPQTSPPRRRIRFGSILMITLVAVGVIVAVMLIWAANQPTTPTRGAGISIEPGPAASIDGITRWA